MVRLRRQTCIFVTVAGLTIATADLAGAVPARATVPLVAAAPGLVREAAAMGAPAASAPEPGPAPGDLQDAPAAMRAAEVQPDEGSARAAARARHHPVQISQSSTATLTKVAQPDGSITAVQYLSPVFHRESGRRVRNDARLAPSSDKVYPLQAQHALHPLHVGHRPDRLLRWDLAAGAVTVTVQGAQPVADGADSRGRVRFPGALTTAMCWSAAPPLGLGWTCCCTAPPPTAA